MSAANSLQEVTNTMNKIFLSLGWLVIAGLAGWLLALPGTAIGQAVTGAISGNVLDTSGAVVPQAQISITNETTGQTRTAISDSRGFYDVEGLPAGRYSLIIRKPGFQAYRVNRIVLYASQRVSIQATLHIGNTQTEVTVTAHALHVNTETGTAEAVVNHRQIQKLLVNGLNFASLSLLIPGVNLVGVGAGELGTGNLTTHESISINGTDPGMNNFSLDGTYNMNTGDQSNINIFSPLDTISEFRVLKDNYSAKYGTAGSAQIQVITESGTKVFHGSAYNYLRNDALDASNFFAAGQKTPLKQNIFGFSLGGPLYIPGHYNTQRQKTFFFVNEQWRSRHAGDTLRGAMLTQAMRNGDLSESPTLGANGLKLDSTATQILAREHPGMDCVLSATQLNPNCFDPNAVLLMNKFWPLPNNPASGFLNYINPGVEVNDQRDDTYRVDQYFSDRFRLMSRVSYETATDALPAATWGPNPAPTTRQTVDETGFNGLIRFSTNISPTSLNEFTLSYSYDKPRLSIIGATPPPGFDINYPFPSALSIPGRDQVPTIEMGGGWAGLNGTYGTSGGFPEHASDGAGTLADDWSKVKGNHVLQAGGEWIWGIKRQDAFAATQGAYTFSGVHTDDPVSDFLLGLDTSFNQSDHVPRHYDHWRQFEPYVQDDWKATRRLTLNLGLRYVYGSPETETSPAFSDFNPVSFDPAQAPVVLASGLLLTNAAGVPVTSAGTRANLLNGIVFPGENGVPLSIYRSWKRAFAPRFGFAWDVFGDGKSALRGGYGMGYTFYRYGIEEDVTNPPWVQTVHLLNGSLTNPALGLAAPLTPINLNYAGPPNATRKPVILQTWSLTLDRQVMPDGVLSVGYVGSRATQLSGDRDLNFPEPVGAPSINTPGCLKPGEPIPAGGFNFDPCINAGLVSPDYTRPLRGWGSITSFRGAGDYFGRSFYNSLQANFRFDAGHNLLLTAAYTYSKAMQDTAVAAGGAQNQRDFRAEYGPAPFDLTHIFSAGYVYAFPFFTGRHDFLGRVLQNWGVSGITLIESGPPLTPTLSTSAPGLATRPNCLDNPQGPQTLTQWFNTSAFAAPPFGFFGNCGVGIIYGPAYDDWNISLTRTFPLTERLRLDFRGEFFNAWNHPNFNGVQTALGTGNFGQVTSATDPREIEFMLRMSF
jgi:hypothetical protein